MTVGIHIFRKDLRVKDNLALNQLANKVDEIIGVFVFDTNQINATTNMYHSARVAQFIVESVRDLNSQCDNKLLTVIGTPAVEIEKLIKQTKAVAI